MPDERVAGLLESSETSPRADLSEPKCQRAPRYEWLNVLKQHGVYGHIGRRQFVTCLRKRKDRRQHSTAVGDQIKLQLKRERTCSNRASRASLPSYFLAPGGAKAPLLKISEAFA
jgi:hypothetical protein